MRLLELRISGFRGIRDLTLNPGGENLVVWGANGSGKSGVVDAVDFLLTGEVARLRGSGTGGVSLSRHGPHVDGGVESAVVSAVVRLPSVVEPVEISRSMANPAVLELDEAHRAEIDSVLASGSLGQHVLTRRDLLRFITANASTRAQQIQLLLGLTGIEDVRSSIVGAVGQITRSMEAAESALASSQQAVATITDLESVGEASLLQFANSQRGLLGGDELDALEPSNLKVDLTPLADTASPAGDPALVVRAVSNLESAIDSVDVASNDERLREILERYAEDAALQREAARHSLSSLGLELLGEDGACPLCDTGWPPGVLRDRLRERMGSAEEGVALNLELERCARVLRDWASAMSSDITTVEVQLSALGRRLESVDLSAWKVRLDAYVVSLSSLESYLATESDSGKVASGFLPEADAQPLTDLKREMADASAPKDTRQEAWDTLTRLEGAIESWQRAGRDLEVEQAANMHVVQLKSAFETARDSVLGALYGKVRDRFVRLYRNLHEHESGFGADLEPSGAGVDLNVDFHGRGSHPPNALHSEGHQDSMGICLYLALSDHLVDTSIELTMLDDVMMSIDSGHRRPLAKLLATEFPGRQLLITTHDRAWAYQLRTEGVVDSKHQIHFSDWDIDSGPHVLLPRDLWDLIDGSVESGDVPSAAHRLRRGSEEFFSDICDGLEGKVRFRLDSRTQLGDLAPAAVGALKRLVKDGKKVAQRWGNQDAVDELLALDAALSEAVAKTSIEQWVVNENVHYNEWADFSHGDFEPVVEAFKDLFGVFQCDVCETPLRVSRASQGVSSVACSCGQTSWTLQPPSTV